MRNHVLFDRQKNGTTKSRMSSGKLERARYLGGCITLKRVYGEQGN